FIVLIVFFLSSRRRHTILKCDWSSDVCSSDLHYKLDKFQPPASATCAGRRDALPRETVQVPLRHPAREYCGHGACLPNPRRGQTDRKSVVEATRETARAHANGEEAKAMPRTSR